MINIHEAETKTKGFIGEFKKFAMRGNVIDLAVGVIIGAAFGKIVNSMVSDVFMPGISVLLGKVDFKSKFISLDGQHYASLEQAQKVEAPIMTYGKFIQNIVEFVIVAFVVFLVVKIINRFHQKDDPAPAPAPITKECPYCTSAIPLKATRCPQCTSQL